MDNKPESSSIPNRVHLLLLFGIAAVVTLVHLFTNGRYGFHQDELMVLSDSRHLDWGFVEFPPLTPLLGRIGLDLFGVSLVGLRLFAVFAQAAVLVVTGLIAKELGGGRLAQCTAALTVALSPIPMIYGTQLQYSSFDYLWWVLACYFVTCLLGSENPRWWLAVGIAVGIGLETKYAIAFLAAGILGGVALTSRRFLKSGWFWGGIALALLIFLPNLLWQMRHDFISLRFLQFIHARDVAAGRTQDFLSEQVFRCINVFAAPLALAGLVSFFRSKRYRMLGWMYLIPLTLLYFGGGRFHYAAPAYPMLLANGAVVAERWVAPVQRIGRKTKSRSHTGGA